MVVTLTLAMQWAELRTDLLPKLQKDELALMESLFYAGAAAAGRVVVQALQGVDALATSKLVDEITNFHQRAVS